MKCFTIDKSGGRSRVRCVSDDEKSDVDSEATNSRQNECNIEQRLVVASGRSGYRDGVLRHILVK